MLRDKYATLVALRLAHERGLPPPSKALFVALSQRFPGAQQELDRRPMAELRARYRQLDAVAHRGAPLPGWARIQCHYHGVLRVALGLKVAMARAPRPDARAHTWLAEREAAAAMEPGEPHATVWTAERLAQIRRPPEGRLSWLVAAWVAADTGVGEAAVRAELFPTLAPTPARDSGAHGTWPDGHGS